MASARWFLILFLGLEPLDPFIYAGLRRFWYYNKCKKAYIPVRYFWSHLGSCSVDIGLHKSLFMEKRFLHKM